MRLENKVIIVTGSTTGIGKAIALRCVKEGAHVVVHGLEKDWGEAGICQSNVSGWSHLSFAFSPAAEFANEHP